MISCDVFEVYRGSFFPFVVQVADALSVVSIVSGVCTKFYLLDKCARVVLIFCNSDIFVSQGGLVNCFCCNVSDAGYCFSKFHAANVATM